MRAYRRIFSAVGKYRAGDQAVRKMNARGKCVEFELHKMHSTKLLSRENTTEPNGIDHVQPTK